MGRRAKPKTSPTNKSATPMLTVGGEASSTRATKRDIAAGAAAGKKGPPMHVEQQPSEKAAGEPQPDPRFDSTQSLAQVLDRLATQLDDSTHTGIGLIVRLMIEQREKQAELRQSDPKRLVEIMNRLGLPDKGPEAEEAFLRLVYAAAGPETSSAWQAKLEQELFSDIASVENLARQGEGRHLEIASAGKLTIADLVSRLVHLRTRLTFWAASLEVYPPPLVGDVVGLIAEAARQLRYAAHLPSLVCGGTNSANASVSSETVDSRTARSAAADHGGIPPTLAKSQVIKAQASSANSNLETDADSQAPCLLRSHASVLKVMDMRDAVNHWTVEEVCEELPDHSPLCEETVRVSILNLIKLGLAERPCGKLGGARLTREGRRIAKLVDD